MLKILTIVGARPQFIKAAAISRMIKEICIPEPLYNLEIVESGNGILMNAAKTILKTLSTADWK